MLEVGTKAPDFELPDQNGDMHKLSDYTGKKVVLYFYPRIIRQAALNRHAAFQTDILNSLKKAQLYLVSARILLLLIRNLKKKYGLAFTLLADPERKVIEAYDVWKEKKNYGKVSMGVVRTTYLIDEQGIIIKANDKVKAADDAENMLKELN